MAPREVAKESCALRSEPLLRLDFRLLLSGAGACSIGCLESYTDRHAFLSRGIVESALSDFRPLAA